MGEERTAAPRRRRPLVLVAGKRPQMRKRTAKGWTKTKEKAFLEVLAETCNVTRACEAAGVGITSAYRRRRENAAFRAAWLSASHA